MPSAGNDSLRRLLFSEGASSVPLPCKRQRVDAGGKQWADGRQSLGWVFSDCAAAQWPIARKQTACPLLFYCYLSCAILI